MVPVVHRCYDALRNTTYFCGFWCVAFLFWVLLRFLTGYNFPGLGTGRFCELSVGDLQEVFPCDDDTCFVMSQVNSLTEMDRFLTDVDHPTVKAKVDISHMVLSDSSPEQFVTFKGCAGHVHIPGCDAKAHGDLPPGHGVVPFVLYRPAINDFDVDGAISLELEYAPDLS